MKLIDLKLNEYLDVLLSDAPAPGGGSVSALAGAQGAALVGMVCDLTTAKKKYAEEHERCAAIKEEAVALYEELAASIDRDTDAYNLIVTVSSGSVKLVLRGERGTFQIYALGEDGSETAVFSGADAFTSTYFSLLAGKKEYLLSSSGGAATGAKANPDGGTQIGRAHV